MQNTLQLCFEKLVLWLLVCQDKTSRYWYLLSKTTKTFLQLLYANDLIPTNKQRIISCKKSGTDFARITMKIYKEGYAFPSWSVNERYLSAPTIVFYPENQDLDLVKKTMLMREPVNIEENRLYSLKMMDTIYGWKRSFYYEYYNFTKILAPNINVYVHATFKIPEEIKLHVINCVGYAFDNKNQPDYKYFIINNNQHELLDRYKLIFECIYKCATQLSLPIVAISFVGAGNFAKIYRDSTGRGSSHFRREIWMPAFNSVVKKYPDITTVVLGKERIKGYSSTGLFPKCIASMKDPENTLFCNAWDPQSYIGNGNGLDHSLDGFMGRYSNLSVSGNMLLNRNITFTHLGDQHTQIRHNP